MTAKLESKPRAALFQDTAEPPTLTPQPSQNPGVGKNWESFKTLLFQGKDEENFPDDAILLLITNRTEF